MSLSKIQKMDLIKFSLGGESIIPISFKFNISPARVSQIIKREIYDMQRISQKNYGRDVKGFRVKATEILADLEMYHTGELLKRREQKNFEWVSANKSSLERVLISTIFINKAIANALMSGGVATLLDLTNFSQIDLFKSSVGKIRVQIIIKELERYGLELKPGPI